MTASQGFLFHMNLWFPVACIMDATFVLERLQDGN